MKRSNLVFTGIAAVIALGVLTNCSDRMGQFKNHRDLRLDNCEKYNQWARKMNKPQICQNNPLRTGPQARPTDDRNVTPINPDPLVGRPEDQQRPPVAPPAAPDLSGSVTTPPPAPPAVPPATPPAPPAAPPAAPDLSGGETNPPTTPPPAPPAVPPATPPAGGNRPAGSKVSREKFIQAFNQHLSQPEARVKDYVKGITVSQGAEGNDMKLGVEAVIVLSNAQGVKEHKALIITKSTVTPAASNEITYFERGVQAFVKKDGSAQAQAEDTQDKILVLAACNEANCAQINLILQFKIQLPSGEKDHVFAACAIDSRRGIKACGFDEVNGTSRTRKSFADVQTLLAGSGLPTQVVGEISGAQSVTAGPARPPQTSGTAQDIESHKNWVNAAKVAKDVVVQQAALVDAGLAEINQAKAANDRAKAEAALTRVKAAIELIKQSQDTVVAMVDDLSAQPDASQANLEEIGRIGNEAREKADAARTAAKQAEDIVKGMGSVAVAPPIPDAVVNPTGRITDEESPAAPIEFEVPGPVIAPRAQPAASDQQPISIER